MLMLRLAAAATVAAAVSADPTHAVLSNGVRMPKVLLGMGLWCNDPIKCPPPAGPCHDCYNDTTAAADIKLAASSHAICHGCLMVHHGSSLV